MKVEKCYACQSLKATFYAHENGYDLLKCDNCGLLYVSDRPDDKDISEAHKQGVHKGEIKIDVTGKFETYKIKRYKQILSDLFKDDPIEIKSWLDVGCGHGEFLVAISKFFPNKLLLKGSEPNQFKQKSAKKRGLDVDYFELDKHKEKYDVISLLNVYSHLPNPVEFFQSLKKLLASNGELIIETGDTANMPADIHYRPFYLPDHLSFASEKIVKNILESLGFEILKVKKYNVITTSPRKLIIEFVKIFLPKYKSGLKYLNRKKYPPSDMFIRARLLK